MGAQGIQKCWAKLGQAAAWGPSTSEGRPRSTRAWPCLQPSCSPISLLGDRTGPLLRRSSLAAHSGQPGRSLLCPGVSSLAGSLSAAPAPHLGPGHHQQWLQLLSPGSHFPRESLRALGTGQGWRGSSGFRRPLGGGGQTRVTSQAAPSPTPLGPRGRVRCLIACSPHSASTVAPYCRWPRCSAAEQKWPQAGHRQHVENAGPAPPRRPGLETQRCRSTSEPIRVTHSS